MLYRERSGADDFGKRWLGGFARDLRRDRKTYLDTLALKRSQLIQRMVDEHQPRLVVMYGTYYRKRWEHVLGGRFRLHPDVEVFRGRRGRSEMVLRKHPAAKGVKTTYFKAVGCHLGAGH